MKKKTTLKIISIILGLAVLVSGCASSTVLSTTPSDADVYIQGQRRGRTPYTYSDRKIAGSSTLITFRKEGYEDYITTIRKNKKLNAGALISGLLLVYPLFWILGYDNAYSYLLDETKTVTEPVPVSGPVKTVVTSKTVMIKDLPDSIKLPTSSRVEKLLSQGQTDLAVAYAEDQEGAFQAGCYYAIAQYYLDNNELQTAEDFFSRSGKISEGKAKIAEALKRRDLVGPVDEKNTASDSIGKNLTAISNEKNITAENPEMKLIAEDDRVLITVDSIVRSSTQPPDLLTALKAGNSSLSSRPARNADYVMVYFSKKVKKPLNLTSGKDYLANISLSDQPGKYYTIILERGSNYIRTTGGGQILWNPAVPQPEGVIVNYSYMMFFMPVSSSPSRLNYIYNYKIDKKDRKPITGTLTINLLH
jgi:hypothetical protein